MCRRPRRFDWGHDEHHLVRDSHVLSQNVNRCVCNQHATCTRAHTHTHIHTRHLDGHRGSPLPELRWTRTRGSPNYWPIVAVFKMAGVILTYVTLSTDAVAGGLVSDARSG